MIILALSPLKQIIHIRIPNNDDNDNDNDNNGNNNNDNNTNNDNNDNNNNHHHHIVREHYVLRNRCVIC